MGVVGFDVRRLGGGKVWGEGMGRVSGDMGGKENS